MSKYLLDTDTLIDFSKGREPVKTRLLTILTEGHEIAVCPITEAEFYAGHPPEKENETAEFFEALTFWPITRASSRHAGRMRYELARMGKTVSLTDCLIAAIAIEQEATILTSNTADYPQPDVTTLSLRTA
jgi:tRNA(fMet)-specific endonuclease VapC